MTAPGWTDFVDGPWLQEACAHVGSRERSRGRPVWVEDAPYQAERLRRLLSEGRWAHQPAHHIAVPKARGGTRELAVFHPSEQALHRALSACLSTWLEGHLRPSSLGFRPRRSVAMAVRLADRALRSGSAVAAEVDVLHCFDEVRHDLVLDSLSTLGLADERLLQLVRGCMLAGARWGRVGLAQGSALSPVLLNAHLHPVDEAMEPWAAYLRYADDLLCLCPDEASAAEAFEAMRAALSARSMRLHPGKSRIVRTEPGWGWLGATLDEDGRLRSRPARTAPVRRAPAPTTPPPAPAPPCERGWFRTMLSRLLEN